MSLALPRASLWRHHGQEQEVAGMVEKGEVRRQKQARRFHYGSPIYTHALGRQSLLLLAATVAATARRS